MNKNLVLIGTALALSLTWVGCNKSGKLAQPSNFVTPTGPVELKLKWPQGERIVQDMDMKQTMEFSMPGQPAPMKQDMTMGQEYGMTVLQANPDGSHEVEMDFLSARMSSTMGGRKLLDYDSAKKSTSDKPNPVAGIFGKIVGSKIQFFLDATNGIERVEGIDEMMNRLQSGVSPAELAPLKSSFSEGYFKQLMSANRFMPPRPVQPGDTWPVEMNYPMGTMGTLVLNYDFTFKSWEMHGQRNCARFEFDGTLKSIPDTNASPTGMSMNITDGSTSGVSWFDPELGITIDTTMNQDMDMVITLPMNPRANAGAAGRIQTITNQMNQILNIKLLSVK
jgi:hypothetical protein